MKEKDSAHFWPKAFLAAFIILLLLNVAVEARIVAFVEARSAAVHLLKMENSRPDLRLIQDTFQLGGIEPLFYRHRPVAYLVRLKPQGFMILSDISEVAPQVFVSFSGDFETLRSHPFLVHILNRLEYDKVHLRYLAARLSPSPGTEPEEVPDRVRVNRNEHSWSALGSEAVPGVDLTAESLSAGAMAPLLTSAWNQDAPYWNYTPRVSGTPTYTGCSATAMAQVMYYWKSPLQGEGSHSYHWNGRTLSANFNHTYYWDRMRLSYSSGYSAEEADAVARLMSDVGIAINMDYGTSSSGAVPNANKAFSAFFKYGSDAHYVYRSHSGSWTAYFNTIKQQLDVSQPVIMGIFKPGSGHAVVADGYRTSPSNQVHVNMGWGGTADNYYTVDNIYGYGSASSDYSVVSIHPTQLRLTLQASAGGTITPAPGTYNYNYGTAKVVRVTAWPDTQYELANWSGDASGMQNPIDITVNRGKTVKANFQRIVYAPMNAGGQKVMNRSLSQAEYINVLTFASNPNNVNIQSYKIYQVENGQRTEVGSVDAATFKYWHRGVQKDKAYSYEIVAVNSEPREGHPATVVVR